MIVWKKRLNEYGISNLVIIFLMMITAFSVVSEIVSIGMFLPLFELINQNGLEGVENLDSGLAMYIYNIVSFIGLEFTIEILLILSFVLFSVSKILSYITTYVQSYYQGLAIKNMKDKLLHKYLRSSASYYDAVTIGDFTNSSFVELPAAVGGVMLPIKFVITIMSAIGSIAILLIISPYLTFISIVVISIGALLPARWVKATTSMGRKNSHYSSVVTSFLLNRLQSPRLVRLSNTADAEEKNYFLLTEKHRNLTLALHLLKARIDLVIEPMIIGISLLMFYTALVILDMSVSMILLYMIVMIRIVPIATKLLTLKQSLNRAFGPIQAINRLLCDMDEDIDNHKKITLNKNLINKISTLESLRLEDISFQYKGGDNNIFSNICYTLNSSSLIAVTGPSGGGKTTFVDIISGYRKPTSGSIFVNDVNIDQYNPGFLLSLVSYVPQFPQIIDGTTIYEHIAYGKNNANKEEVVNAAKLSGAYDFIKELPEGFNTIMTGGSSGFSGGQRQKIDLSRALLRDTPILILDEPTSNLDFVSEKELMLNIKKIRKTTGKIIIVIAHRLHTIIDADQIIVLEGGNISDVGTHSELLLKSSWYKSAIREL